jgi:hypothetical protein
MQSAPADGEHVLLVGSADLSPEQAPDIYRQLHLAPGTWRVKEGTVPLAPEMLPSSDALQQGLLLLNKTIRAWLNGARAQPTVAPIVVRTSVVKCPFIAGYAAQQQAEEKHAQHSTPQRTSPGINSQHLSTAALAT